MLHNNNLLLTVLLVLFCVGCSNHSTNPTTSEIDQIDPILYVTEQTPNPNTHNILGSWNATFDLQSLSVELEPNRALNGHFNISTMIPPPEIVINSYNQVTNVVDVDVTITNPYQITAYDVRIIIFTDSIGHKLTNADDWTGLYDIPNGYPINPFKAFGKEEPNRRFLQSAQLTENLHILLPGGNPTVGFALDASYPVNCDEPYEISNFVQADKLYDLPGSSTGLEVTVLDWFNDVNHVQLYCPEITGVDLVNFSQLTTETWELTLANNTGASAGDYSAFLLAKSDNSGPLTLFDEVVIQVSPSEQIGWNQSWGGDDGAAYAMGVTVDENNGYVYAVGSFTGTVDFDPGPGVFEATTTPDDMFAFVIRFDLDGNYINAFTFGNGATDMNFQAIRIACDNFGDVYVLGNFWGTIDFGTGSVSAWRSSGGQEDVFIARYSPTGRLYFALVFGGSDRDYSFSVATDNSNMIYIGGTFSGTADFNPNTGVEERTAEGYSDTFISCISRNGYLQWVSTFGSWYSSSYCLSLDTANNHVFATGYFGGIVDFDPGSGEELRSATGSRDCYLVEYDNSGDFQAVNAWGGEWYDEALGYAVGVDSVGNAFIYGVYDGVVDFDPGTGESVKRSDTDGPAFISKFDSSATFQWVRTIHLDYPMGSIERHCTVTNDSNVYLTGKYYDTVDFDPSPDVYELTSNGYADIYLVKIDSNGDFAWARSWGGESSDVGTYLDTDSDGNSYLAGSFMRTVDFDPGNWVDEHIAGNSPDAFIMRNNPYGYWD
jgi:hypothetical protein